MDEDDEDEGPELFSRDVEAWCPKCRKTWTARRYWTGRLPAPLFCRNCRYLTAVFSWPEYDPHAVAVDLARG